MARENEREGGVRVKIPGTAEVELEPGQLSKRCKSGLVLIAAIDLGISFVGFLVVYVVGRDLTESSVFSAAALAMSAAFIVLLLWAAKRFIGY